jgi:hypothetical protein
MQASLHYSRMEPANTAGLRETLMVGGEERIARCLCVVTWRGIQPPSRILSLQAGMAVGPVSPDYSRALGE